MVTMTLRPRRLALVVLLTVVVAACGGPDPSEGPPSASPSGTLAPSPTPRPTATPPPSASPPPTASPAPPIASDPPPLGLEPVVGSLAQPAGAATGPDGWLLVHERAGRVVAVDLEGGATTVALDIGDRVLGQGERGLLGLALHPDWPDDPRAFVHYSDRSGSTVLSELRAAGDGSVPSLDPASETILLQVAQPYANHNGGQLAFGPDGFLWFGLGDGGSGGDPAGNGQNPATLLGSVLRLDVSEPGAYAIPDDNPFADGADGAPEVALYGLRNPWRFSFDRATGLLWIADVGQNAFEEINRVDPVSELGANLGWNVTEATHCYLEAGCATDGFVLPVAEYGRELGCSVSGGHVYRGSEIPGLGGWYLFADYCTGLLFGIPSDVDPARGTAVAPRILLETGAQVSSFGEDADGELYLTDLASGTLYRVVPGD